MLSNILCAPPGGQIVSTINGLACGKGKCVVNNLGYLECSKINNGEVFKDIKGDVVCVGGCESPSQLYCIRPER